MLDLAAAFGEIAGGFGTVFGGPYWPAMVIDQTPPVTRGGSIVTPGGVAERGCSAQVDSATEAMRTSSGFADGDVRFIIIGLSGTLGTDARVRVADGPHAGLWSVTSLARDPAAIGWVGQGRRA